MRKISCIYSILHIASGKSYIGSALDSYKRFAEHKFDLTHNCHDNPRLQNAWNKYGPDAFEFRILEEVSDPTQLLVREQYWMDKLQSYDRYKGFNIRKKAESNLGLKHKPETIEKIKRGGIGKHKDQIGQGNSFFGKKHTEASKQKMRESKINPDIWEIRFCLECGKEFKIRKSSIRFNDKKLCSLPCWYKYKTKERVVKTCEICNKQFESRRSEARFCSLSCTAKHRALTRWNKQPLQFN